MIFGYEKSELEKLGALHTATEIHQQPRLWLETFAVIEENKEGIEQFFKNNLKANTRIVLTGAGTSDYVGKTIKNHLSTLLSRTVEAIPTTDIVSNPQDLIYEDVPTILVSFARSGNSPESVGAFDLFNNIKEIAHLVFTCNPDGALAKKSIDGANNLRILMPTDSDDKGFAMTGSFSCMMLSALLAFDIHHLDANKKIIEFIANQGEQILETGWAAVKQICGTNPSRMVYLGSGFLQNLAQELMLKNLELTNGNIVATHESILGYRHGPKTFTNDETVIIVMISQHAYTHKYDIDLIKEMFNDDGKHQVVVLDYGNHPELKSICHQYYAIDGAKVPSIFTVFNYLLYGQMIGLYNSIRLGFTADNPVPSGAVNRVVKGVTIHSFLKMIK